MTWFQKSDLPSEQKTVSRFKGSNRLGEGGSFVLQSMGLINNQVRPRKLVQNVSVNVAKLVGRYADMPRPFRIVLARAQYIVGHFFSSCLVPMELDCHQFWRPSLNFIHPVTQRTFRHDDQVRPSTILVFHHVNKNWYRLKSLSQSHLYWRESVS